MAFFRKRTQLRKKAPKRRAPARKPPLAKLVKSIVARNLETKIAVNSYGLTNFNSAITGAGDYIAVLPQVFAGSTQNGRIGGSINPIKLVIRGYMVYKTDAIASARMIGTRMFCFSDRAVSCYPTAISAGPNFQLLDNGGAPVNYTGSAINYCTPHNVDLFKWYADKKHTMQKPYGLTNTLSPTATTDITGMDRSLYKPFTITIPASKMPSTLKYDEVLSTGYPVNFAPYLAVGYSDLLGYTADTVVTQIGMEFVATLYYKDA